MDTCGQNSQGQLSLHKASWLPQEDECEGCDLVALPCTLIQGASLARGPRLLLIITKPRPSAGLRLMGMIRRQSPADKNEEKMFLTLCLFLDTPHRLAKLSSNISAPHACITELFLP